MKKKTHLLFLLLILTFSYFGQGGGFNQNSNVGEVREFVEHGTFDITPWKPITGDIAFYKDKIYSNKSPSVIFFIAPVYFLIDRTLSMFGFNRESLGYQFFVTHIITILFAGIWGALLGLVIFYFARENFKFLNENESILLALACTLATLVLPYATVAFTHSFETFWCIFSIYMFTRVLRNNSLKDWIGFSFASGTMVLSNPILAPAAAVGGILALLNKFSIRNFLILGVCGALPLIPFFIYNKVNFDSFLATNRHFQNSGFTDPNMFLGVFHSPQLKVLLDTFWWSNRSLAPSMVWLYLAIPGLYYLYRDKVLFKSIYLYAAAVFCTYVLFMMTFNNPHGGSCYGPRYMVPVLVIMGLFSAPMINKSPRLFRIAVSISYVMLLMVTFSNMFSDFQQPDPFMHDVWPSFRHASFSGRNWPLFVSPEAPFHKYVLGQFLGLKRHGPVILLLIAQFFVMNKLLAWNFTLRSFRKLDVRVNG